MAQKLTGLSKQINSEAFQGGNKDEEGSERKPKERAKAATALVIHRLQLRRARPLSRAFFKLNDEYGRGKVRTPTRVTQSPL